MGRRDYPGGHVTVSMTTEIKDNIKDPFTGPWFVTSIKTNKTTTTTTNEKNQRKKRT